MTTALANQDMPIAGPAKRVRLEFLDGLRGLSALWVVLYHVISLEGLPPAVKFALGWSRHGQLAVAVFIVLSGYCLMLPAAREGTGGIPGGFARFFSRRARRILPPYYAALALICMHVGLSLWLKSRSGVPVDWSVLGAANVGSHLLLLHNLSLDWVQTLDPPMWSVATEWQIYFLFPLLLFVWKRSGNLAVLACGVCLGLLPHLLLPAGRNFDWARPWYLGLFGFGMMAAAVGFSRRDRDRALAAKVNWLALCLVSGALTCAAIGVSHLPFGIDRLPGWLVDTLAGVAAASLIVHLARFRDTEDSRKPAVLKALEARTAITLGRFSYSLYLMHFPILWTLQPAIRALHLNAAAGFLMRLLIVLPVILALSYVFYLIFERPFTQPSSRIRKDTIGPANQ